MSKVKVVEVVHDDDLDGLDDVDDLYMEPKTDKHDKERHQSLKSARKLKSLFKPDVVIGSIYTGGPICIARDDSLMVGSCGQSVSFINTQSGLESRDPIKVDAKITALALSPAKDMVVVACTNLQVSMIDVADGSTIRSWRGHESPVLTIDFHPSGGLIATGSSDGTVKIWDIEKGFCTHNFKDNCGVISVVKFQPGQLKVVAVSDDQKIRLWDLVTKTCLVMENHLSSISAITFSNSGNELVSAGRDKVLNYWDLKSTAPKKTLPIFQELGGMVIVPKDALEAIKETVDSGNLVAKKLVAIEKKLSQNSVMATKIANDGLTVVIGGQDVMRAWCIETGECVWNEGGVVLKKKTNEDMDNDPIYTITSVISGTNMLVSVTTEHNLIKYDFVGFERIGEIIGYNDEIVDIKYITPTEIAVATNSNEVAMSRKGASFAVSASADRTVKLWNWSAKSKEMETVKTVIAHDKDINTLALAPNDKIVASGSQDGFVKLWSTSDLSPIAAIRAHKRGVWSVEFSPVDQCVMSCAADGTIKVWSLADHSCIKTFEGHTGSVLRAAFITHGMQIVSVGSEGLVKLWTIKTNECVKSFESHDAKIWALTVSKDQQQFITGAADSKIIVWNDHTILEEEKLHQEREQSILNQQALDTSLWNKDYSKALKMALILDQPQQTLKIFNMMLEADSTGTNIKKTLLRFGNADILKCLKYIRDWNTNSKFVKVAQVVLNAIITSVVGRIGGNGGLVTVSGTGYNGNDALEAYFGDNIPCTDITYWHDDQNIFTCKVSESSGPLGNTMPVTVSLGSVVSAPYVFELTPPIIRFNDYPTYGVAYNASIVCCYLATESMLLSTANTTVTYGDRTVDLTWTTPGETYGSLGFYFASNIEPINVEGQFSITFNSNGVETTVMWRYTEVVCAANCSSRGTCNNITGACLCDSGYGYIDCSIALVNLTIPLPEVQVTFNNKLQYSYLNMLVGRTSTSQIVGIVGSSQFPLTQTASTSSITISTQQFDWSGLHNKTSYPASFYYMYDPTQCPTNTMNVSIQDYFDLSAPVQLPSTDPLVATVRQQTSNPNMAVYSITFQAFYSPESGSNVVVQFITTECPPSSLSSKSTILSLLFSLSLSVVALAIGI
eukprot:gene17877-21319_t